MRNKMLKTAMWTQAPKNKKVTFRSAGAKLKSYATLAWTVFAVGCSGAQVSLDSQFPTPLLEPLPVHAGIVLTKDLLAYNHNEEIKGSGNFDINIGVAQRNIFSRLGEGLFSQYTLSEQLTYNENVDATLLPEITKMQISLPSQTRSEYFEVWMRYEFHFYDNEANLIGSWVLPAYGKANQNDYRGNGPALKAAALSACRDAMAFFSLNFQSNSVAQRWAAGEKGTPAATEPELAPIQEDGSTNESETTNAEENAAEEIDSAASSSTQQSS